MTNKLTQFTAHYSQNSLLSALKKSAFTLAETLIVMGIIGVVAALTLPNLNSSTGDKEKVTKVKKIYSNLNDAMGRAIAVYGPYSDWILGDPNYDEDILRIAGRLMEFMKFSKDCGTNNSGNSSCFSGSNIGIGLNYSFITSEGTGVAIATNGIYVDIDGPNKGTNTPSKDIFAFNINNESGEITPYGDISMSTLSCGCFTNKSFECTAWVVNMDNMDYWKCPDKLSETVTSCK